MNEQEEQANTFSIENQLLKEENERLFRLYNVDIKDLHKEIDKLKSLIRAGRISLQGVCDLKGCDFDDIHEWLKKTEEYE